MNDNSYPRPITILSVGPVVAETSPYVLVICEIRDTIAPRDGWMFSVRSAYDGHLRSNGGFESSRDDAHREGLAELGRLTRELEERVAAADAALEEHRKGKP